MSRETIRLAKEALKSGRKILTTKQVLLMDCPKCGQRHLPKGHAGKQHFGSGRQIAW